MPFRLTYRSLRQLCCSLLFVGIAHTAIRAEKGPETPVSVALLSDPHFDPFRDPSKVNRLVIAPVAEWQAILSEPDAPDAPAAYAKLQAACGEKGSLDANHDLLQSAFAATANGSNPPAFVLVAGDLLVHQFDCRYRKLIADSNDGVSNFAQKTVSYVALQLHARLPHTPVYIALGNNDSGCGDYNLDPDSAFLHGTADAIGQGWTGATVTDRRKAQADYNRYGSYSLPLPAPMQHTRILVLDDLFLSTRYKSCDGSPAPQNVTALLDWLQHQLADAQAHGEHVWLLAHIPTGINTYATYLHSVDVCSGAAPEMFLSSAALDTLLLQYAGTIRLFVTGHTHLDELHLEGHEGAQENGVVMKTVPSISPVSKNPPSFLTGTVDPRSATLLNYRLHTASASTGNAIQWSVTYDFQKIYNEPALMPDTIDHLLHRFAGTEDDTAIANYQQHMAGGLRLLALQTIWPQYVCSMQHSGPTAFAACACAAQPVNKSAETQPGQRAK